MSGEKKLSRRVFLRAFGAGAMVTLVSACAPKVVKETVLVEKEKVVKETVEVEKVVKETVEVKKEVKVEKEVTRIVAPAELSGELTFWAWDEPISQLMKKGFEAKYPGVTANYEIRPDYESTIFATLVAGAGLPDAFWIDSYQYQKLARTDQLLPVDEWVRPYKEDILSFLYDAGLWQGTLYGIPRRYAPEVLWYRKDRYEEVGIDAESIETWDDFIREGKKATDDTHSMTVYDDTGFDYNYQSMLFGKEGTGFYDAQDNVVVNSAENLACTEKYVELVKSGVARPSDLWSADWYTAANKATMAGLIMPYWYGSEPRVEMPDTANKWGIMRTPSIKSGVNNASTWQGAMYWVVPKTAEKPEMGWKFAEYTTFDYKDPYMQESMDREFVLPAYKKFMDVDYFWGDALLFYGVNLRAEAAKLAEGAPVNYLPPEYEESEGIVAAEMVKLLAGEQSAKQMLDACADEFKKLLEAR